jgi:signal transduction histidine kinase
MVLVRCCPGDCLSVFLVGVVISNYTQTLMFRTLNALDYPTYYASSYTPAFALLFLAVFACIAILRYRLYDIDLLMHRTLVYGTLSAFVIGTYMLAVAGFGALFQARGNLGIPLVATVIVAVLFQPLRSRLQRGVNRLMYSERDDPSAVTSRLGSRLEVTLSPEAVLPTIVETISQALKLPYVAILMKEGEGFRSGAAYRSPRTEPEALPLIYQREEIGRLVIAPRAPGEQFSSSDRSLLEELVRQTEVAVHAVRLTADLQSSRERLVTTREEERRRLRRDLRDGIGPTLTDLALQLHAVRELVRSKPGDAEETLARLGRRTEKTLAEMRRLIYGLRPLPWTSWGSSPPFTSRRRARGWLTCP